MKPVAKTITVLSASLLLICSARQGHAQGMPAEARANIHALFGQHTNISRSVTMTKDGYVAVTESKDPQLAKILREHVSQMRKRLQSGRMLRGWDPAFREMVEHYDDITHRVETTTNGLKITVKGKTPAAIQVARNHAKIVSQFAKNGWDEHDVRHPRVVDVASREIAKVDVKECLAKTCGQQKGGKDKATEMKSCCRKTACSHCAKASDKKD